MSLRIVSLLASVIALPLIVQAAEPDPRLAAAARKVRQVIAHRGSSSDRPENTLASYRRAIEVGAAVTEIDVRSTRDGVLVSLHDADLSRTTNGKGLVGERTLAELQQLDAGSWFDARYRDERVPTVQAILELCKGKIDVMLDLKETGDAYALKVAALVRRCGEPRRTVVGVRSVEQARLFRKLLPEARQIGLVPTAAAIEDFAAAGVPMIRLWPKWLADKELVPRLRKLGLTLHLGADKGGREEVLALLPYEPASLSSDDPGQLIRTLAEIGGKER
jgi:glycerophosphoryl diester phosphodiesterase